MSSQTFFSQTGEILRENNVPAINEQDAPLGFREPMTGMPHKRRDSAVRDLCKDWMKLQNRKKKMA